MGSGLFGAVLGAVVGALFGEHVGISGRKGVGLGINGSIPCALIGAALGGLAADKLNQLEAKPVFPREGTPVPTVNHTVNMAEQNIMNGLNYIRGAEGLPYLRYSSFLSYIARYKSQDMCQLRTVSLDSPLYGSFDNMLAGFGCRCNGAAIGLGQGYFNPSFDIKRWLLDSNGSSFLLHRDFTDIGIGYVGNGGYFTVILAC